MRPSNTKKRASPNAVDSIPALSTPGSERQSKRAKVAGFRILGRGQEHPEHEPLRDPDTCSPGRLRSYKRASSTKPRSSLIHTTSIFSRGQSVPLEGEVAVAVPAIDFTNVPSSPRRLPSMPPVEVQRTPSLPPLGNNQDLDAGDTTALLHYTNHTQFVTPHPNPVSHYTVNFATPRLATPSRPASPHLSPLSPLTPSPPPSFTGRLYGMQTRTDRCPGMTPKAPLTTNRSISVSKPPPDAVKLKQTSLKTFIKPKPFMAGGSLTSAGSSSSIPPPSSPSKIPLLSLPRRTSGRSLTTLSQALDKLVVPPPSRPNTSMGFVRAEGSGEESTGENRKGKRKTQDDASLPGSSTTQGSGTTFARPTASSLNRAATMTGLGSRATTRMGGRGGATVARMGKRTGSIGVFGKSGDRASKKPNLPVVQGSPVKGSGGTGDLDEDNALEDEKHESRSSLQNAKRVATVAREDDVFTSQGIVADGNSRLGGVLRDVGPVQSEGRRGGITSERSPPSAAATASNDVTIDLTAPAPTDKGKQRVPVASTLNLASSALQALSESLSTLPQTPTPPKARAVGTRTGLRSSTATADKESPTLNGFAGPGVSNEVNGGDGTGPSSGTADVPSSAKKSSLKILKRCVIFVDVRTEQGDNAGSLFVDMLKGLGAKIMSRLGRKCTHIVYKNGHPNTLTRYRLLDDPKPVVVGIAWVVECVEKRARIEEDGFKIDVDLINVAGGVNKRRRSMLPKHLIPSSPGPDGDISMHMSSEADDDEGASGANGSPTQDSDLRIRSREEDDLPPLERARRRRTMLPGGQTRLIPL